MGAEIDYFRRQENKNRGGKTIFSGRQIKGSNKRKKGAVMKSKRYLNTGGGRYNDWGEKTPRGVYI